MVWWELLLPLAASVIICFIAIGTSEWAQTTDTEFWTEYTTKANYYEDWNEEVPCIHTTYCDDGDGNSYPCGTDHLYDVDYHPEYWTLNTSGGHNYTVSKRRWNYIQSHYNLKPIFRDLHRDYHNNDGDMYYMNVPMIHDDLDIVVAEHTYENRVQAATSVFNFLEVTDEDKAEYKLNQYYSVHDKYQRSTNVQKILKKLDNLNARLGAKKQVRVFIYEFDKDSSKLSGEMQEALWKGGNKNEIVITYALQDGKLKWNHVFSWTDREIVKINIRNKLDEYREKDMNLEELLLWLEPEILQNYQRKHFSEFDYLTIDPTPAHIIISFIVMILINLGLGAWLIHNQY